MGFVNCRHVKFSKVYGIRAIIEAIKSNESIDKIFLQRFKRPLFSELEQLCRKERLNVFVL